jgi:hypothetical protein
VALQRDPGVVVWREGGQRWWSVCQVRPCKWKSSHEHAQAAIDAMRAHLIQAHLREPIDARSPEERDE